MTRTERLALPHILPGQSQKELFHNEALQMLDVLVAGAVEEPPRSAPPASPVAGKCYIIASGASGEWQGRDGRIAAYTSGGWRFLEPQEGIELLVRSSNQTAAYRSGGWELGVLRGSNVMIDGEQVIGAKAAPIVEPAGGVQVDAEARTAIGAILAALRQHGLIAT